MSYLEKYMALRYYLHLAGMVFSIVLTVITLVLAILTTREQRKSEEAYFKRHGHHSNERGPESSGRL